MKDTCYLVMSEYGIARMTKRAGSLKRGEVSVRIRLTIPDKCFAEPSIDADIVIPESAIIRPDVTVALEDPQS